MHPFFLERRQFVITLHCRSLRGNSNSGMAGPQSSTFFLSVLAVCAQSMGRGLHQGEGQVLNGESRLEWFPPCIDIKLKQLYLAGAIFLSHNKGQVNFHAV